MTPDAASILIRAAGWITLFQADGCALFLLLFGGVLVRTTATVRKLGSLTAAAAAVLVIGHQLLEPARMADEFAGIWDAHLQALAWTPDEAAAPLLQSFAMGMLASSMGALPAGRSARALALVALAVSLLAFTVSGHTSVAAASRLLTPLLAVHVAIVAFWVGSLLPLWFVSRSETAAAQHAVFTRFSRLALRLVPALALVGIAIASILLPDWSALRRPYALLLGVKLGLFALLMVCAALNRRFWAPGATAGTGGAPRTLRRSLLTEAALAATVLAVTATLTTLYSPVD